MAVLYLINFTITVLCYKGSWLIIYFMMTLMCLNAA